MSPEGKFLIYCIEIYKFSKHLSGKETIQLFEKYHVQDYVKSCYKALRTTGEQYIINDLDLYIKSREIA